ncbi:hypothetical protein D8B22_19680 [Verminephrobacter aporrectodeae subsp. tuberculatae]|nr:hypothetical protein [Verminephrobacter aporrectodeae subsp. tuberculatae]MCW8171266.1 hypothetical protein [Verminephrobacter aporrectodeae subsp. tuberculatae]
MALVNSGGSGGQSLFAGLVPEALCSCGGARQAAISDLQAPEGVITPPAPGGTAFKPCQAPTNAWVETMHAKEG